MRVLYITTYHRTGGWLAEAFSADSAVEVVLEEALGVAAGVARLRDEVFDAVLISHEPGELDALDLIEGLRAGGSEEPIIVLGTQSEQELAPLCYEVRADAYVCVNTATTRSLIWIVARSIERHQLVRENRRLSQAEQHRLRLEHNEAERLLEEQRSLVRDLESLYDEQTARREPVEEAITSAGETIARQTAPEDASPLPSMLVHHYRELLRAYVIMGTGNLAAEMSQLAELLASAGVSAPQTMQLHLQVLEDLVRGLGTRSARHVMTRADLLVLEVLIHLTEGYRERYFERRNPPQQLLLPGFEQPAQVAF
jgi:DNA-binding response OmpR family regulator